MPRNEYGVYIPSESRKFAGKWFSLAWWTGITSKYRANQFKKMIKQSGSKPYLVRHLSHVLYNDEHKLSQEWL